MGVFINRVGDMYGRLTVLERGPNEVTPTQTYATWRCTCSCGVASTVRSGSLVSGLTQSCGCLRKEHVATIGHLHGTHRQSRSPEYRAWRCAYNRCYNPKDIGYSNYGERSITMCRAWRRSFETFLACMGKRPSNKHSLDRINNNGNYTPTNCKWSTKQEQMRNRRPFSEWKRRAA